MCDGEIGLIGSFSEIVTYCDLKLVCFERPRERKPDCPLIAEEGLIMRSGPLLEHFEPFLLRLETKRLLLC